MSLPKLRIRIENVEKEVQRLRPTSSPGVLTNSTTRGVTSTPLAQDTIAGKPSDGDKPVWL